MHPGLTPSMQFKSVIIMFLSFEGVVALWCNPLTLQPEQSGGVGSKPSRVPPLELHEKGSQTHLALSCCFDPRA